MSGRSRLRSKILQIADLMVMVCAFAVAMTVSGWYSGGPERLAEFFSVRISVGNLVGFLAFAGVWHLILRSFGLYRSSRIGTLFNEWSDTFKAVLLASLVLPALALVLDLSAIDRHFAVVFLALSLLGTCLVRGLLRALLGEVRRHGRSLRNVVVVGCGRRGAAVGRELRKRADLGYLLLGYVDDIEPPESPAHHGREKRLGSLDELEQILVRSKVDELFVTLPIKTYYARIAEIIAAADDLGAVVRMPADFFNVEVGGADVDFLERLPIMTMTSPTPSVGALLLKRTVDVVGASLLLLGLSPLMALTALAIRLDSRGPLFFAQERVGLGRRRFQMFKFRTMVADAEARIAELSDRNECRGAAFKIRNDPRVTRVGRWLRRLSIDELPQLWNVLIGDMSLVGPRPLPDRDVEGFDRRWLNRRFSVKPGLTCIWQANGRHEIGFDEWMELDIQYVDHWSLGLDFAILLKTVPAVLRGTGAS